MLVHLGLSQRAEVVKNAWLRTIEDGVHTPDVYRESLSAREVGTADFAEAVVERLGERPRVLEPVTYHAKTIQVGYAPRPVDKRLVGVDVFICWDQEGRDPEVLAGILQGARSRELGLRLITNRGVKVYPEGIPETFCTDHWRCRFRPDAGEISFQTVIDLLQAITDTGLEIIKTENLCTFDGVPGFSMGQGE
jgi:isocitrate dehydrogenase